MTDIRKIPVGALEARRRKYRTRTLILAAVLEIDATVDQDRLNYYHASIEAIDEELARRKEAQE